MDDLLPWLRTQIAAEKARAGEDLRFAKAAAGGTWVAHESGPLNASYLHVDGAEAAMFSGWNHRENLLLAARFDPDAVDERATAVLAQCEAHVALFDLHAPRRGGDIGGGVVCSTCVHFGYREYEDWPCLTVLVLALAYQHCPGYREEWRPT